MTQNGKTYLDSRIIPYQELLGNYDCRLGEVLALQIIPYQELLGNYDTEWQDLS